MERRHLGSLFACAVLLGALLVAALSLPGVAFADEGAEAPTDQREASSLRISYGELKCGTPTAFDLSIENATGTGLVKYQLSIIRGFDPIETKYAVVDNSRQSWMANWTTTGKIEFTFYASGTYDLTFQALEQLADGSYKPYWKTISISINDPAYPSLSEKARKLVAQCAAAGKKTDFDKALWLHDWILDHCTYDYSLLYCNAEGALARGTGTCEAYHRAYVLLLNTAGIQTGSMAGNGHRWTAAKLDGKWYQIDVTWDDYEVELHGTYPDVNHLYFGLNDATMKIAHSDHSPVAGYQCTSLDDNYFIRTREIEQWSAFALADIKKNIASKKTAFSLPVEYPRMTNPYRDILYNLVAYDLQTRKWSNAAGSVGLVVTYADGTLRFAATYKEEVAPTPPTPPKPIVKTRDMHRLYNPNSGEHFYTASTFERDSLVRAGWRYEGVAWKAPVSSKTPVYRLYSGTDHHYTTSRGEALWLVTQGWSLESTSAWYSDDAKGVFMHRLFNPGVNPAAPRNNSGSHHYTASRYEADRLVAVGWRYEGGSWYGCA